MRAFSPLHHQIYEFVANLSILTCKRFDYKGENLPNITLKCLQKLLIGDRIEVLSEKGVCSVCGNTSSQLQRDHLCPTSLGGGHEGQLLCIPCHTEKTTHEASQHKHCRNSTLNMMMSWFNPHTSKHFVQANHPLQVVRRVRKPKKPGLLVDVKRCRRNALADQKIAVFLNFVEKYLNQH